MAEDRRAEDTVKKSDVRGQKTKGKGQSAPVPSAGAIPVKCASLLIGMNFTGQAPVKWALPFIGMPQLNKKTERFNGVKISLGTAGQA